MKKIVFLLLFICFVASCSTSKSGSGYSNSANTTATASSEKGSSFDNPIVIEETSERAGVDAEYTWLRKNYPGFKLISQALTSNNKKPFDLLIIETADGVEKKIYFDISKFFGKY